MYEYLIKIKVRPEDIHWLHNRPKHEVDAKYDEIKREVKKFTQNFMDDDQETFNNV